MRVFFLILCCMFFVATTHATQICKPTSIPASTPDSQLIDNLDGTITDSKTGLMWKQCLEGAEKDNCKTSSPSNFTWQGLCSSLVQSMPRAVLLATRTGGCLISTSCTPSSRSNALILQLILPVSQIRRVQLSGPSLWMLAIRVARGESFSLMAFPTSTPAALTMRSA